MKKIVLNYIVLLSFVPLFFIHVSDDHDWGDDFAMYIRQAECRANYEPQQQNFYLFNKAYPVYAPKTYPVGFPILLGAAVPFSKNTVLPYKFVVNCCLVLAAFFLFQWLHTTGISISVSWLCAIATAYHPFFLYFKDFILSDIPLFFFIILYLYFFEKYKKSKSFLQLILLAFIACFTFLIKTAGIILPIHFLLYTVIDFSFKQIKNYATFFKSSAIFIVSFSTLYILCTNVFTYGAPEQLQHFIHLGNSTPVIPVFTENITLYHEFFKTQFTQLSCDKYEFIRIPVFIFLCIMQLFGIFWCVAKKRYTEILGICLFLILIYSFPNYGQGFRYLLPLVPFIVFFIATGLQKTVFCSYTSIKKQVFFVAGFLIVCLLYVRTILFFIGLHEEKNGAYNSRTQAVFSYIKKHTKTDEIIVFHKPRILGLFTERWAVSNNVREEKGDVKIILNTLKPRLCLTHGNSNEPLKNYLKEHSELVQRVETIDDFTLYWMQ